MALPVMPTTPFLILAAYFFMKSHPKFYYYLVQHPKYGRSVFNWFEYGTISKFAKKVSVASISFTYMIVLSLSVSATIKIIVLVLLISVIVFLLTRPSDKKDLVLIFGNGNTSQYLKSLISEKNVKCTYRSNKKDEDLYFDSQDRDSWRHIPYSEYTIITMPVDESFLQFYKEKKHLLGKIVGIGTTSIYKEGACDEKSEKNCSHDRFNREKILIEDGAIWAIASGLYDNNRPHRWLSKVYPENNVNLVHREDLARAIILLMHNGNRGELYNVSEGSYLWKDLAKIFYENKEITQEDYNLFIKKEGQKRKYKIIKSDKIKNIGFTFKHTF